MLRGFAVGGAEPSVGAPICSVGWFFEFADFYAEQTGTASRRVPLCRLHLFSRMGLRLNKFDSFGARASSSLTVCRLFVCRRLRLASRLSPLRSAYTLVVGKAASSRQGSSTALRRCRRHSPRFARRYARFARCALALGSGSPPSLSTSLATYDDTSIVNIDDTYKDNI